ncbi:hypothetical protein L9F63_014132, partial [Diploptera punctata]
FLHHPAAAVREDRAAPGAERRDVSLPLHGQLWTSVRSALHHLLFQSRCKGRRRSTKSELSKSSCVNTYHFHDTDPLIVSVGIGQIRVPSRFSTGYCICIYDKRIINIAWNDVTN